MTMQSPLNRSLERKCTRKALAEPRQVPAIPIGTAGLGKSHVPSVLRFFYTPGRSFAPVPELRAIHGHHRHPYACDFAGYGTVPARPDRRKAIGLVPHAAGGS